MIRFCFLFCFVMTQLNAQSKYLPCELQLNNGEKLVGEIAYNGWFKTPNQIKFKIDGEVTAYGPETVRSFIIGQDRYIGKK